MKIALYKGTSTGFAGIFDRLVKWWFKGIYCHGELIFSNGICASSSARDGGVRFKKIDFKQENWDIFSISGDEEKAYKWFKDHEGDKYDYLGLLGFVLRRGTQDKSKEFCTEAIMSALGNPESWRFDPCTLGAMLYDKKEQ
jgi:hypothetical protein